ncbi:FAD-dependent oxidoreductase [Actinopolymorpha singaporensis]|uniref:2-polyprenyl-6-methoxyphenol hydroxylase n=1 Tax=Actinopolymorpha singaporensis TaxID=117157 RepID=A0A1H1M678_9ACTN|nr:FAD-dependent oxidoreductase [Actinopolymorpha singaporensis]SDR82147.1 2-polyprenyl-6-methoxyphenol hydroxylase [Actinopolymorpha singaporensis]
MANGSAADPARTTASATDRAPARLRRPSVTCVVVGGGPGGMIAAYLLARAGVRVTLLEAHADFDRNFRGDTLHPATLELLDTLGLADELLRLDHYRARYFRFHTPTATITTTDYGRLRTRFPYVALMPQDRFLDFMAAKAAELPTFTLRRQARVTGLLEDEDGVVQGVRYRGPDGEHELPARLVIGADGRFSRLRRLADMPAESFGAGADVLWFELPRRPRSDPPDADVSLYFGVGGYVGVLGRTETWQVGYTIPKGKYAQAREAGVVPIQDFIRRWVPWLADRAHLLADWSRLTLLSVDIARVERWHRPGLLLIGDAAHVISPVGGNGILMAIQDAVTVANVLARPLRQRGLVSDAELARVQENREPAIISVQRQQIRTERRSAATLRADKAFRPPLPLRLITEVPLVRWLSARSNAYGPRTPRLDESVLTSPPVGRGAS